MRAIFVVLWAAVASCRATTEEHSSGGGNAGRASGGASGAVAGDGSGGLGGPSTGGVAGDVSAGMAGDGDEGGSAASVGNGGTAGLAGDGGTAGLAGAAGIAGMAGAGRGGLGGCAPIDPGECNESRCPSNLPPEATTCAPDANDCGCNGSVCPNATDHCLTISVAAQIGFGGPSKLENHCFSNACAGDQDCSNGTRCMRTGQGIPVCSSACRFDSECTAECGGRCLPRATPVHAGTEYDYAAARCAYPGACGSQSCALCSLLIPSTSPDVFHHCGP